MRYLNKLMMYLFWHYLNSPLYLKTKGGKLIKVTKEYKFTMECQHEVFHFDSFEDLQENCNRLGITTVYGEKL